MAILAPSILSADFLNLGDNIRKLENAGIEMLHIDIMDGHFVPNLTFGPALVEYVRRFTRLKLDVHLMMTNPQDYIDEFCDVGADYITVHQEACMHLDRVISLIKKRGAKAGVALNPATPPSTLQYVLDDVDIVLVMSVNPGFGGQKFIERMLFKVAELDRLRGDKYGYQIEVDGGINNKNVKSLVESGADIIVAGTAVFRGDIIENCKKIGAIIK
ncbi:ribulose-phosphate 3-epimerase [Calorimonas adulescens]|uniref:Ribulose-phosphate 3-epimerase n=1 Tax=Calorimonas adulescens TaxID=2606906 RepID=A0A5D8QFT1_9THEO|nr:ribulose-phosphate 3-epimerase [Calorimonas adulescens]TZE83405.1 ribulose-phosphate 3-epimerase [Calorimonas adulescens]